MSRAKRETRSATPPRASVRALVELETNVDQALRIRQRWSRIALSLEVPMSTSDTLQMPMSTESAPVEY